MRRYIKNSRRIRRMRHYATEINLPARVDGYSGISWEIPLDFPDGRDAKGETKIRISLPTGKDLVIPIGY
jgi:hypothetical protein